MGKVDLHLAIPVYFRCPISLETMKSPVSLTTGVTYDRSSIQKWFDHGHITCPVTMQSLERPELIPNHTLRRLIKSWSASMQLPLNEVSPEGSTSCQVAPQQVSRVLQEISNGQIREGLRNLSRLANNENSSACLLEAGVIPVLASVFSSRGLESGYPSLDVVENLGIALQSLLSIPLDDEARRIVAEPRILKSMVWCVRNGKAQMKANSALLLEALASSNDLKLLVGATDGLLDGLLRMLAELDPLIVDASLRCLFTLCTLRRNAQKAIASGAVLYLIKLLRIGDRQNTERALAILELLCGSAEGRAAVLECPLSVPTIMRTILSVSEEATEHAMMVIWAVCMLAPGSKAPNDVVESNGVTKILLLLQRNCSSRTKDRAGDLLRICREISKHCSSTSRIQLTHVRLC